MGTPRGSTCVFRAAATSSCARGRTRECGCLAFGAEVVARSAHVCDHTDVTQTLILALQIREPPEVPHLCRAAATRSCARGTRECGCRAIGAAVVARGAHVCDHAGVTQTLVLSFQICPLLYRFHICATRLPRAVLPSPLYLGHREQPHFPLVFRAPREVSTCPPYLGHRGESPPPPHPHRIWGIRNSKPLPVRAAMSHCNPAV